MSIFPPRRADADADARSFRLRARTRVCAHSAAVRGNRILDVGCSFGWFERFALENGAAAATGVDVDDQALAVARRLVPQAAFLRAAAAELPYADASFEVVTLFDVLEHVPRRTEADVLAEARRVLVRGGQLALTTPHRHWLPMVADPAWYLGHRHYRLRDVVALAEQAGFVVTRTVGGIYDTLDRLAYYCWRHVLHREQHPFETVRARADGEWDRDGRNTIVLLATAER